MSQPGTVKTLTEQGKENEVIVLTELIDGCELYESGHVGTTPTRLHVPQIVTNLKDETFVLCIEQQCCCSWEHFYRLWFDSAGD